MRIIHEEISCCAECPYVTSTVKDFMTSFYCLNKQTSILLLFSDYDGDSYLAHKQIHKSCRLPKKE